LDGLEIKEIEGNIYDKWAYTGKSYLKENIKITSPLKPNQIIGVGKNFSNNLDKVSKEEFENPVLFFKSTSSITGPFDKVYIPDSVEEIKYESELAVVIGREGKNIKEENALNYVFGYTVVNDFTAPQFFHKDGHWFVGKSFDTLLPVGPVIQTELPIS